MWIRNIPTTLEDFQKKENKTLNCQLSINRNESFRGIPLLHNFDSIRDYFFLNSKGWTCTQQIFS